MQGRLFAGPLQVFLKYVEILSLQSPFQKLGNLLRIARKAGDTHGGDPSGDLFVVVGTAAVGNGEKADDRHPGILHFA